MCYVYARLKGCVSSLDLNWQSVSVWQNLANMVILPGSGENSSCCVLDQLEFVYYVCRATTHKWSHHNNLALDAWTNFLAFIIESICRNLDNFLRWKSVVLQIVNMSFKWKIGIKEQTQVPDDKHLTEQPSIVRQYSSFFFVQ